MWLILIFGLGTLIATVLNINQKIKNRETKFLRFISLVLTALTVCAFYSDSSLMAVKGNITGLMDVMPTVSKALWIFVIISVILNAFSLK